MRFPDEFIYSLKQNNPLESVAAGYVTLRKQSRDYICLCPFHSEKSPSCHIHPAEGYFHCFGCGAGGDVITFIMKAENLEYPEAVRFLAEKAGMTMPEDSGSPDNARIKARILELNRSAARLFNHILAKEPCGERGRRYFLSRQLSAQTITKYGLGYAPDDWQYVHDELRKQGFTDDELVAANICSMGKGGRIYDQFRDRVMFPIIDLRGNVIAFGGRMIDGNGPKYLNSADTPAFNKKYNLFSLNFAKNTGEKRLILAEGYMDVISMNQAGFENAVATLGTALTAEQVRLISRYAEEVVLSYDSDGAGQAATKRAINMLSESGVRVKVLRIDGAKDPDEYIKKFGSERFRQLLDNSGGAVNFQLDRCRDGLDTDTETGKVEFLKRCAEVISQIRSPIERDVYISKLARENAVSADALKQQVSSVIGKRNRSAEKQEWLNVRTFRDERAADPESVRAPAQYKAECGIISYIASNPEEAGRISEKLPADNFITPFNRTLYERLTENLRKSPDFDVMSLQSEFTADEMGKITAILDKSRELGITASVADEYISVLKDYREKNSAKHSAADMDDDSFRDFAKALRSKK